MEPDFRYAQPFAPSKTGGFTPQSIHFLPTTSIYTIKPPFPWYFCSTFRSPSFVAEFDNFISKYAPQFFIFHD